MPSPPLRWFFVILFIVWQLSVGTRRWHDRNKSGAWNLIVAVPFIGFWWGLIELGFLGGTVGWNEHGEPGSGSPFAGAVSSTPFEDRF